MRNDNYFPTTTTNRPLNRPAAAMTATATAEPASYADPADQARAEWDGTPSVRHGFSSKEAYVAYRKSVLNGTHRPSRRTA